MIDIPGSWYDGYSDMIFMLELLDMAPPPLRFMERRVTRPINIKPPVQTHVIKMRFKRKRIRCNRRGMGPRLRRDR